MKQARALAQVARVASFLAVIIVTSGCGYRIVRNSDVTAQRFAQDSAAMATLRGQLATVQTQCRADSARLEHEIAAQRTAAAALPAPNPEADSLLRVRTVEVAALREQLAKVNAELDRIKRRLSNPRG